MPARPGFRGLRSAPCRRAQAATNPEDPIYLIQLLLPLYDNEGRVFPRATFSPVRDELTERFGGLTAYTRAPAQGLWSDDDGSPKRDDIIVYEVMADTLDRDWWRTFRARLEHRLDQEEIVIRAQEMERL